MISAALILPQSILLGTTFPLMSAAVLINILVAVAAFLVSYSDSIQPSDAADMTSPADSADMAAPIEYPLSPNHL
jgi:hypothetical protein